MELHSHLNLYNNLEVVTITDPFPQIWKLRAGEVELNLKLLLWLCGLCSRTRVSKLHMAWHCFCKQRLSVPQRLAYVLPGPVQNKRAGAWSTVLLLECGPRTSSVGITWNLRSPAWNCWIRTCNLTNDASAEGKFWSESWRKESWQKRRHLRQEAL